MDISDENSDGLPTPSLCRRRVPLLHLLRDFQRDCAAKSPRLLSYESSCSKSCDSSLTGRRSFCLVFVGNSWARTPGYLDSTSACVLRLSTRAGRRTSPGFPSWSWRRLASREISSPSRHHRTFGRAPSPSSSVLSASGKLRGTVTWYRSTNGISWNYPPPPVFPMVAKQGGIISKWGKIPWCGMRETS